MYLEKTIGQGIFIKVFIGLMAHKSTFSYYCKTNLFSQSQYTVFYYSYLYPRTEYIMKYGAVRKFYPRKLPKGKEVKEQGNFSALPAYGLFKLLSRLRKSRFILRRLIDSPFIQIHYISILFSFM